MSNFMHKVKDAMTDRDERDPQNTYSSNPTNQNQTSKPFSSSGMDTRNTRSSNTNPEGNTGSGFGGDQYGSSTMRGSGSGNENVGPHDSRFANKMDPRVDSDQDNRGKYDNDSGYGGDSYGSNTMRGSGGTGNTNVGPHESRTGNKMDPRVDSDQDHRANLNKPTNPFQSQPSQGYQGSQGSQGSQSSQGAPSFQTASGMSNTGSMGMGQQPMPADTHMKNEENYSSSTQEHKSRSTTSHATPCQEPQMGGQMGSQMGGPMGGQMGGQMGQQFGGGGAPGGSSYNQGDTMGRQPGGQGNLNKLGTGMNEQQQQQQGQGMGHQRGY